MVETQKDSLRDNVRVVAAVDILLCHMSLSTADLLPLSMLCCTGHSTHDSSELQSSVRETDQKHWQLVFLQKVITSRRRNFC